MSSSRFHPSVTLAPYPIGIDMSDTMLRVVELRETKLGIVPVRYDALPIPPGLFDNGAIVSKDRVVSFLRSVQQKHRLSFVHVALPTAVVYTYVLKVPVTSGTVASLNTYQHVLESVESHTSLSQQQAMVSYRVLHTTDNIRVVEVQAIELALAERYLACFVQAGLTPLSFETPSSAAARVLIPSHKVHNRPAVLISINETHTSITIVHNGAPIYTATVAIGGEVFDELLTSALDVSSAEAARMLAEHGISSTQGGKKLFTILAGTLSKLADGIGHAYTTWRQQEKKLSVGTNDIYLYGPHSSIEGLADYLSLALKLSVVPTHPWHNCLSLDDVVPMMDRKTSYGFAIAVGLCVKGSGKTLNVLPPKERLRQRQYFAMRYLIHRTVAIVLTVILAIIVAFCVWRLYTALKLPGSRHLSSQKTSSMIQ